MGAVAKLDTSFLVRSRIGAEIGRFRGTKGSPGPVGTGSDGLEEGPTGMEEIGS
jgi:hypothetical protein